MVRMAFTVGVLVGVTMALLGCSGSRGALPEGEGVVTPDAAVPAGDSGAAVADCPAGASIAAHSADVALAAYSPDGRFIMTLGSGELKLWNAADLSLRWTQPLSFGGLANAQAATFTPDSTRVLVTGAPPRFLGVTDGQTVGPMLVGGRADTVAISRDGTLAAGGCQCSGSGGARLWWASTGAMLPALGDKDEQAFAVAFSPVDSLLAVRAAYPVGVGLPGTSVWRSTDLTRFWDADREVEMPTRLAHNTFSPDGALLASLRSSAGPSRVDVRRVSTGAEAAALTVAGRARQTVFSRDGRALAVAAEDGLHLFETARWSLARDFPGTFLSAGYSPDGHTLIAGSADGVVRFFCP